MADTITVRGEGGAVFTLDLPVHEAIQEQLDKGTLLVLEPEDEPKAPAKRRAKAPEDEPKQ